MAERIIEQWRLAVLRVELDLSQRIPAVSASLLAYPNGIAKTLWSGRYPLDAFGLNGAPPKKLFVPDDLRDAVAHTLVTDLKGEAALWLRLVPPHGFLGSAPWEASLIKSTNVPMLRVPDRLPVARTLGRVWCAAIAVSAKPGSTWAAPYIRSLLGELRAQLPAQVEIDVFADAGTVAALHRLGSLGPWARIHDPADAQTASSSRTTRFDQSMTIRRVVPFPDLPSGQIWADWMAAGLGGRAVNALHIVADAAFDDVKPMLAISPDPQKPVPRSKSTLVGAHDVPRLADSVGAATLSFSSPPRCRGDLAMRMIADTVGQQRAGATIYSSVEDDPTGQALAGWHAFIYDPSGASPIPRDPAAFAYAQPEDVQSALREAWPGAAPAPPPTLSAASVRSDSRLADLYAESTAVPTWVASSDRYLGTQFASLAKSASSPAREEGIKSSYDRGSAEALTELQNIVERYAAPS